MEHGFEFFNKTFCRDIYQNMINEQENRLLLQTLIRMQTVRGIDHKEAAAMASVCIAAVTSCESIRHVLSEDMEVMLEELLALAERSSDAERILHKLYFGLAVYPDFVAENEQMSVEEFFWRYYTENKETKTIETLKEDIRHALIDYRVTPKVMQAMVKKIKASGDYLAAAAALGEGGISFKCIAAMELYLNNQDTMTIHEAANMACAEVEVQAAADAVAQGFITREMAKKILILAGITLTLIGLGIMVYNAGYGAAVAKKALGVMDQVMSMPEVFKEFASYVNMEGEPVFILNTADKIRKDLYAPLIKAAKHKETIGGIVMALGAATLALSKKTADLIGKFSIGFTKDADRLCEGMQMIAAQSQIEETRIIAETDQSHLQEDIQQQTQTAVLGGI